jgi:biopolymer transport protein ExbB
VNTVIDAVNSLIELGGPVVMLLLAMSIVGTAILLVKLLQLNALSGAKFARVESALEHDSTEQLQNLSGPIARLVQHGLAVRAGGVALDTLEADLARRGNRLVSDCSRHLRPPELIAYLSPLLGLLGTVLGMIDVFQGLEGQTAQGDAGALAGGIWEALLTTAVGLGIAIPMTAAHALLETRVQRIAERLSQLLELVLAR